MMATPNNARPPLAWYRVPVVWLGILILAGSMAGCIWIIVVSVQYRDEPVAAPAQAVLGVPVHPHPPPASAAS
jgi:hypothetical protein